MNKIEYQVFHNNKLVYASLTMQDAIDCAFTSGADVVVKFDLINFEPLSIVWEWETE